MHTAELHRIVLRFCRRGSQKPCVLRDTSIISRSLWVRLMATLAFGITNAAGGGNATHDPVDETDNVALELYKYFFHIEGVQLVLLFVHCFLHF